MAAGKKENQNADHMIRPVAYIHTDFPTKFGIPRQSGLTGDLEAKIVFEPEFSNPEAIRGIEEFSHLWLIWEFSENVRKPGNMVSDGASAETRGKHESRCVCHEIPVPSESPGTFRREA